MGVADSVRFYLASQYLAWKTFLSYRFGAVLWLVYGTFSEIYTLIAISVIYSVSSGIAGWSYYQLLLLSSASTMIIEIVSYNLNVWSTIEKLRNGDYDPLFSKPYGLATIFLSTSGSQTDLSGFASGLIVFVYSAIRLKLSLSSILIYLMLLAFGGFAMLMFMLMLTMLAYLLFRSGRFANEVLGILETASTYPLNIYGPILAMLFTVAIPIGIGTYYPAGMIFGKISPEAVAFVVAASAIVGAISYRLFYILVKHYTSGGG